MPTQNLETPMTKIVEYLRAQKITTNPAQKAAYNGLTKMLKCFESVEYSIKSTMARIEKHGKNNLKSTMPEDLGEIWEGVLIMMRDIWPMFSNEPFPNFEINIEEIEIDIPDENPENIEGTNIVEDENSEDPPIIIPED